MSAVEALERLSRRLGELEFSAPVTHVYNPLVYAGATHRLYWEKYGRGPKEAIFLGMNPGPWGMAQTGVPFGEVTAVREWMGIEGPVEKPLNEHPKRPIEGFGCRRSEVSGKRLWGWAATSFGSAEEFFSRFFVINYCPLIFMEESGRNRTPDKLPLAERKPLIEACDHTLSEITTILETGRVIGVGRFAAECAARVFAAADIEVGRISHPSPANPAANKDWAGLVKNELAQQGIIS